MSDQRVKVTTQKDEWEDFTGSLIVIGLIFIACVGVGAALFKFVIGLPTVGATVGAVGAVVLVIRTEWMREAVMEAVFIVGFLVAIVVGIGLLVWAFN